MSEHLVVFAVAKLLSPSISGWRGSIPVHLRRPGRPRDRHFSRQPPRVGHHNCHDQPASCAHGGGCACKIAPGELERMVAGLLVAPPANPEARLVVGRYRARR